MSSRSQSSPPTPTRQSQVVFEHLTTSEGADTAEWLSTASTSAQRNTPTRNSHIVTIAGTHDFSSRHRRTCTLCRDADARSVFVGVMDGADTTGVAGVTRAGDDALADNATAVDPPAIQCDQKSPRRSRPLALLPPPLPALPLGAYVPCAALCSGGSVMLTTGSGPGEGRCILSGRPPAINGSFTTLPSTQ